MKCSSNEHALDLIFNLISKGNNIYWSHSVWVYLFQLQSFDNSCHFIQQSKRGLRGVQFVQILQQLIKKGIIHQFLQREKDKFNCISKHQRIHI